MFKNKYIFYNNLKFSIALLMNTNFLLDKDLTTFY